MSNKIGRFEIISEITHSEVGSVCKATDTDSGQTVALKTIKLELLGDQGSALAESILQEAAASKVLNSHNIAALNGADEVDTLLCASMEYVQGNSIATMLARKEGFSIWDLQDIARQACQAIDHANARKIVHHTLEPAKIMVQWDGIVKLLAFGVSTMGAYAALASGKAPETLHYMSPEQLRGEPLDARSNMFSLGAILYEMVTERKAFEGENADELRQTIFETTPVPPVQVNPKIHPVLSEVIMKALSRAPEERYQSGQDLVIDLERCKEAPTKPGATAKTAPAKPEPRVVARTPAPTARSSQVASAPPPLAKAAASSAGGTHSSESTARLAGTARQNPGAVAEAPLSMQEIPISSAAVVEPELTTPKIAVDPMMDENRQTGDAQGRSFSDINELPPLKEVYVAPPPPPLMQEAEPVAPAWKTPPPKPKAQTREVARKAVAEIQKTPPKLFMYSIAGAIGVILLVVAAIAFHYRSADSDDDNTSVSSKPVATAPTQPVAPPATTPAPAQVSDAQAPESDVSVTPKYNNKKRVRTPPPAPAIISGQLNIDSTPQGAQIQVDGESNASWVTPYNLAKLMPGQHTVTISKAGYAPQTRTLDVNSGSKSVVIVQLAPLTATVSLASDPAGVSVWMDGKDTGHVTPTQISVDKPGAHTFLFRKQGYLESTTTANVQVGQTLHLTPALQALGNTNEIRIGGKFKKMFGGSDTAGMGTVTVKTQPKNAQVAVNNRVIDKTSPVEFYLNPGNYEIDITLSGFKSIHRVVTVEKNGKVAVDEVLDRE